MKALALVVLCSCGVNASDARLAAYGAEQIRCVDINDTPEGARACIMAVREKFNRLDGGHE